MTSRSDLFRTGYGVAVAGLRDDPDGVRALLADLDQAETAAVAEGAVAALADAVRMLATPQQVTEMIHAVQALAHEEAAAEGN